MRMGPGCHKGSSKRQAKGRKTDRWRRRGNEDGMDRHAATSHELPAATREARRGRDLIVPLEPSEGTWLFQCLDSRLLASRTGRKYISTDARSQAWVSLLQQPPKTLSAARIEPARSWDTNPEGT